MLGLRTKIPNPQSGNTVHIVGQVTRKTQIFSSFLDGLGTGLFDLVLRLVPCRLLQSARGREKEYKKESGIRLSKTGFPRPHLGGPQASRTRKTWDLKKTSRSSLNYTTCATPVPLIYQIPNLYNPPRARVNVLYC